MRHFRMVMIVSWLRWILDSHRGLPTRWIVMHCEKAQVELRDALQYVQEITAAVCRAACRS
jgi:hypothetical protein